MNKQPLYEIQEDTAIELGNNIYYVTASKRVVKKQDYSYQEIMLKTDDKIGFIFVPANLYVTVKS